MPELIYRLSLIGAFLIVGITLWHAWGDRDRIAFFGLSIIYGFLVEKATIALFGIHSYPEEHFFPYLWEIPISVLLAWGVIIYASLMAGWHLGLQRSRLAVFVGLFTLHIDLAIDAIAVRIPFWTWHLPGTWFDVPLVNFVGWYSVALLFTGFFLSFKERVESYALAGLVSLLASTSLLIVIVAVWLRFVSPSADTEMIVFSTLMISSLAYVVRGEVDPSLYLDRFPVETFLSIVLIHLFYIQTILYYGYHQDEPLLLYISITMMTVGIAVHYLPYLNKNKRNAVYEHFKYG